MKEEEREQSHSTRPNFGCTSSLKSEDSTFLEKLNSLEYKGLQELFVSTLLGEARFSGALKGEASKAEEVAKNAVAHLREKLAEHKKLSVSAKARESVLHKQAVDLSEEVSSLQEASEVAESRCESRLRSLREELEGQQETLKSVLVGMVKQLGLEERVAGNMPPMASHHAPRPKAPPAVVPPIDVVAEENVKQWIEFWKKAPQSPCCERGDHRQILDECGIHSRQASQEDVFLLCRANPGSDDIW